MTKLVSPGRLCELIEQWASYTSSDPFAADTVDALRELQGLRAPEPEATINQCDGCRRGLPVENGTHRGPGGFWAGDTQACTADRYALKPSVCHHAWGDNGRCTECGAQV